MRDTSMEISIYHHTHTTIQVSQKTLQDFPIFLKLCNLMLYKWRLQALD
jgi:hypothetical protein